MRSSHPTTWVVPSNLGHRTVAALSCPAAGRAVGSPARWRPGPAGAAARRAERPTRILGPGGSSRRVRASAERGGCRGPGRAEADLDPRRRCCSCCAGSDSHHENLPSSPRCDRTIRLRWLLLPARRDRAGGPLVPTLRALSYRDVEELLAGRSIEVDHVTVYRWVQRFTPLLARPPGPAGMRSATTGRSMRPTPRSPATGATSIGRSTSSARSSMCSCPHRDAAAARAFSNGPSLRPRSLRLRSSPTEPWPT
jgi:hypothetical protein